MHICLYIHSAKTAFVKGSNIVGPTMKKPILGPILILLHSERPKLYTILAFLSAIGLKHILMAA